MFKITDKKACDNVVCQRKLNGEKTELFQKLSRYQEEKKTKSRTL